ncbi:DNA-3-methyladenine glycosylase I [Campylobacter rectus]|uniref:DNA-3-methyladenine glycosylase I n=1 Tax=Campylobacter rectus TaxID=203 RepID=UPI0028DB8BED|nr:DNA-3-methyladenine glycosylase I [Campylobacter rectus]
MKNSAASAQKIRCDWAEKSELERVYHDEEWGKLVKDDAKFFELIVLESFQAGISWHAVLLKREAMRAAFDGFDARKISLYGEEQTAKFMQNPALIRNRLKLNSLAANARAFLAVVSEFGSFYDYLWGYLLPKFDPEFDGKPIVNHYENIKQIPATTPLAEFIAKEMKKRGFKFLGPTSVYAFLQSAGVVDDHLDACFCKGSR